MRGSFVRGLVLGAAVQLASCGSAHLGTVIEDPADPGFLDLSNGYHAISEHFGYRVRGSSFWCTRYLVLYHEGQLSFEHEIDLYLLRVKSKLHRLVMTNVNPTPPDFMRADRKAKKNVQDPDVDDAVPTGVGQPEEHARLKSGRDSSRRSTAMPRGRYEIGVRCSDECSMNTMPRPPKLYRK